VRIEAIAALANLAVNDSNEVYTCVFYTYVYKKTHLYAHMCIKPPISIQIYVLNPPRVCRIGGDRAVHKCVLNPLPTINVY
jgi:hypothetical protein